MKRLIFLAVLLLSITLQAQNRLTGVVLNWTPPAGSDGDTIVKTNLTLSDDYVLGLSWDCEGCDSVYLKYTWSNGTATAMADNDSVHFRAPLSQAGSSVDSVFINGDSQGGVWLDGTPYPYNAVHLNQVGGTKAQKIVIKRTITTKHR